MPAVPAPHLEVHGSKQPWGDHWPWERGAGREHPTLTPPADSSGRGQYGSLQGPQQRQAAAEAQLITLSDGWSLFPCFTLPSPLHLCTKHRPAPKRLGQALFPGWWGRGVSSTAWLLLTSRPASHPTPNTPQKYVQDILQEQLAEPVYRALKEQGGHIYVCGDVTMAADVLKAIQRIMTQKGKLSVEDAGVFISRLRVSDGLAPGSPFLASCLLFLILPVSVTQGTHDDIPAPIFTFMTWGRGRR